MYDYGYSYGYGLIGGNTYNPLINYNWSTTTTSGLRYLKDVGSTPTYNASMYFGRGAYLNGVDQTITVPINTTIQTALKRVNGVVTINETSQILTNYVISGLGVHKDYYLFTRLLTTAEKDSYIATPELFYAMAQADNTCVLNMPMCETDEYVRNMKSYSEGSELTDGTFISTGCNINGNIITATSAVNDRIEINIDELLVTGGISNKTFLFTIKINNPNTAAKLRVASNENSFTVYKEYTSLTSQEYMFVAKIGTASSLYFLVYPDTSLPSDGSIEVLSYSVKEVTGICPITNYTSSVRDNAKNLQYGLQTCKFVRDSLGVIQSGSDYLECDGVGYANTGWTPDLTKKLSIEFIVKNNDNLIDNILIGCIDDPTNRLALGFRGTNARILLGNAYPQYAIASTIYYGTLTITGIAGQSIVYINGEYKGLVGESTLGIPLSMFWLGGIPLASYKKIDTRLFKVHNKVLTQAEVTANYNSYVAKGLLS